ncbi:outer membrane pore protein E [Izhakiella capsodis]|uniref:Outer membrane porin PhoE n=1 Tax=Izhakiella capsodis TaxID=1367852 RepID=A0A1I4YK86_9GAMM|nr:porin [Izhakiella capsodis]SFN38465.1 outer membrane pore protein E [Izhakiella capsodis]
MKKYVLVAVLAAMAVPASANAAEIYNKDGNKLDFYGKLKAMHYFSDNSLSNGDKSYFRMGFRGETKINDLITGYGQWESQFNVNNSEGADANNGNKTRLGFAGLKFGDIGSFDYGRNFGVLYDVESWTDMFPEFGGDGSAHTDNFMTQRATGVATYRNNDFFGLIPGLKVALQYQGKNSEDTANLRAPTTGNGDGYGVSLSYAIPETGLSISSAFTSSDRTAEQQSLVFGHGNKAEAFGGGIKYDANGLYLAAIYTQTYNMTPFITTNAIAGTTNTTSGTYAGMANKATDVEVLAQYQFNSGLRPSLGYVQTTGHDIERGIGDADLVKYIDVGATYFFNKNMSAMVDYKINQLNSNNKLALNNDDVVALGLTYLF